MLVEVFRGAKVEVRVEFVDDGAVVCETEETDLERDEEVVVREDDPAAVATEGDYVKGLDVDAEYLFRFEGGGDAVP